MNRALHTIIKMGLAMIIGYGVAEVLQLDQALAAGILAVLSIQSTRTDSVIIAFKRLLDAALALSLATLFFLVFGYTPWVFVLFALPFIALSFVFKIEAGIVPSLVLASHLLAPGAFDQSVLINSGLLMIVAVGVALGLGLLYPMGTQRILKYYADELDSVIKKALHSITDALRETITHEARHQILKDAKETYQTLLDKASAADKDLIFDKDHQIMHYLRMRDMQMRRVNRLHKLLDQLTASHPNAYPLADYIEQLIPDIGAQDKATPQLKKLQDLLSDYRKKPLPSSREAFETRAVLFQMVFELEALLQAKRDYHNQFTA